MQSSSNTKQHLKREQTPWDQSAGLATSDLIATSMMAASRAMLARGLGSSLTMSSSVCTGRSAAPQLHLHRALAAAAGGGRTTAKRRAGRARAAMPAEEDSAIVFAGDRILRQVLDMRSIATFGTRIGFCRPV